MRTLQEWQAEHFRVERDYAKRIMAANGDASGLLKEGYGAIKELTDQYAPGLSETGHTALMTEIVKKAIPKRGRVFDAGCAKGDLVAALYKKGYACWGMDIAEDYIKVGKKELFPLGVADCIRQGDVCKEEIPGTFDGITMDNVIEHIIPSAVPPLLKKLRGMLTDDGRLIIVTPNRLSGPHDISMNFLPLGSRAEGFHLKEYTFTETAHLLRQAGFRKVLGFALYPPWYKRFDLYPSQWAARKNMFFEWLLDSALLGWTMRIDKRIDYRLVSVLFPGICIGVK